MRLSGLASGFDTDEMVKSLMQIERMKVDRVEQNKQTILWRQEQYNDVNKTLANFILNTQKDIGLKKTTSTGTMLSGTYKNLDYVKKATSSDETVATVTSTGVTTNGTFRIEVGEPPRNASFTSAKITVTEGIIKGLEGTMKMTFKINNHDVNVGDGKEQLTMDDVVKAINNATIKNEDGKMVSLGVNAFYDKGTGRMFLDSSENASGDDNFGIKITGSGAEDSPGGIFAKAMIGDIPLTPIEGETPVIPDKPLNSSVSIEGSKGKVTVNGVPVETKNGKLNFNGLTIDIKSKSTDPVSISVITNTQGIMDKVEKLVADYNELIDTISGLTSEKRYNSYKPLSSEERKAMNEEDLKLWDEKAKSGLLNRDETLGRMLQNARNDIYKTLEGATGSFTHITQIGISTEKYSQGSAGGKLEINTDKLRKAIEEDAESVMELLFKDGKDELDPNGKTKNTSTKGVFTRVYDDLIDGMKAIIDKSGPGQDQALFRGVNSTMLLDFVTTKGSISDLDKSVAEMNRQIDNLNILLARKEDSHYAKFTAMEKAMYQMNNQSGWLAQQFQY